MNDAIFFLSLVLVFVLSCLAAARYGLRLRARARNDVELRYRQSRFSVILFGFVLLLQLVAACHNTNKSLWKNLFPFVCFSLPAGIILFQFLKARKQWQASPEFKSLPEKKPVPFFWQAVFILLPVVLLAGFGLYSLRQDRVLAEQEARESGEVLAQRIAQAVGTEGVRPLADYRDASFSLQANHSADLGLSSWSGGAATESNEWQRIKTWQQANPDIDLFTLPPIDGDSYGADRPLQMPPAPPEWLAQLNPGQQQLWLQLKQADLFSQGEFTVSNLVKEFLATDPPKGARANANYFLLLAQTRNLSISNAVSKIAEYSRAHWGSSSELSDAGLPLGQLICYQALRLLPDGAGLPGNFVHYHTVAWMINYDPSVFSPVLISETERVTRGMAQEPFAATLRAWWNANAAARQVMADFQEQHPTNTWKSAVYWVDSRLGTFAVMLNEYRSNDTNSPTSPAISFERLIIPKAVVEKAVVSAVGKTGISLPAYSLVEFEWGGKAIPLSLHKKPDGNKADFPMLGQANGSIESIKFSQRSYPFRVTVSLASPQKLYARQSLRTWMFGALIVLSFAAAVIALLAARRGFLRQLQLNEQKSNFVSSVSHELRAPIASVRLMAENLEGGRIPDARKQREYYHFIGQECRRLSALIENVLDFSRIEQGRKQYEFEPTDLVALTETTVKLMEPYAAEKGVALRWETSNTQQPTSNIELNVDGRTLQQALVNLIDNAVKHSPKGATVTVEIETRNSKFEIRVSDHGPGIPAAEHARIFERFYRRGSELRRETQGIGIGLSLVKHIVEAHGGRVTVQSEPGKGSTFTIELFLNNKDTREQSSE